MVARSSLIAAVLLAFLALPAASLAESSSGNFIMWANVAASGGARSTSTNFINFGTAADSAGLRTTSTNFQMNVGFEALYEEMRLTMSISTTSVALSPNPLSTGSVSTGTTDITVSTNADFGYALTIVDGKAFQQGSGYQLADVTDGAVTAGSEEFGVSVSGTDAAFGDDRSIPSSSAPRVIASRSIPGASIVTTVTFKAAISTITPAGMYKGSATFIATPQY